MNQNKVMFRKKYPFSFDAKLTSQMEKGLQKILHHEEKTVHLV